MVTKESKFTQTILVKLCYRLLSTIVSAWPSGQSNLWLRSSALQAIFHPGLQKNKQGTFSKGSSKSDSSDSEKDIYLDLFNFKRLIILALGTISPD